MQYSPLESKIEALIAPTLVSMGYSLVRIKLLQGDKRNTLQIMAEKLNSEGINLDECSQISKSISAILDVEDPIAAEYLLEVSSPGMDRPLVKIGDFTMHEGKNAKIHTFTPVEGRRKFKGKLLPVKDEEIGIQLTDNEGESPVYILISNISSANLLVTADSLKEILNKQ